MITTIVWIAIVISPVGYDILRTARQDRKYIQHEQDQIRNILAIREENTCHFHEIRSKLQTLNKR